MRLSRLVYCVLVGLPALLAALGHGAARAQGPSRQPLSVAEALTPYKGPTEPGVQTATLYNTVMCGYQGWFMARDDGYQMGYVHWGPVDRKPPSCTVDLWPDVSELDDDEKFPTNYRHADGSPAYVFSSTVPKTVQRHFRWMQQYGIDGAFVQRFSSCLGNQDDWNYRRTCAVLHHCRAGAHRSGRALAVMYDAHFDDESVDKLQGDWSRLVREMQLPGDSQYIRHRGGPVVGLWGFGFEHRKFDAAAAERLFEFFQRPENGGCTILLGVPQDWAGWQDERMRLLKKYATVISPWTVGSYGDAASAAQYVKEHWPRDLSFCREHDKDYYPVAFPGFSWTNLEAGKFPLNQIPRERGKLFWSQIEQVRAHQMNMVYVAMFDEVDEGTAIFKCSNHPPVGQFCRFEGLPGDFYLRAAGNAGRYLRGEAVGLPEAGPAK